MTLKQLELWHWLAVAVIAAAMMLCGCRSSSLLDGVKRIYPTGAESICERAYQEALSIVRLKYPNVTESFCLTVFVPSERMFGRFYAWFSGNVKIWVSGEVSNGGKVVKVAADRLSFNYEILVHEYVHQILISNGYGYAHRPEFDRLVFNWRGAREVLGKTRSGVVNLFDEVVK